jgi:hypothetical protein
MARDVFSRQVTFGGTFAADGARITFADFGAGLLVQNLSYQYQQNISRMYEVGSTDIYLVAGRTQGQVSMARVLGPKKILPAFYRKFGDVCLAGENNMKFSARTGCGGGGAEAGGLQQIDINHIVISQMGGSVNANDMIINETLSMMFLFMVIR